MAALHWVIAGGESGHRARPMHPEWLESLRYQCDMADVPFLFKQWGRIPANRLGEKWLSKSCGGNGFRFEADGQAMLMVGKKAAGRLLDGVEHNGFPEAAL